MNCPNCSKDGVPNKYWLAAWPFKVKCIHCGAKIRSSLSIKHSVLTQTVTILLLFIIWVPLRDLNMFISLVVPAIVSLTVGMLLVKKYSTPRVIK